MTILHKRTNRIGGVPAPADLEVGQIAINYAVGQEAIFIKNSAGNIVKLAFPATAVPAETFPNVFASQLPIRKDVSPLGSSAGEITVYQFQNTAARATWNVTFETQPELEGQAIYRVYSGTTKLLEATATDSSWRRLRLTGPAALSNGATIKLTVEVVDTDTVWTRNIRFATGA